MKTKMLLVLGEWLLGVALASCRKEIYGTSHSSIHFPTLFDQSPKEVIWKRNTSEGELQIAKIRNRSMTERLDDRYSLGDNERDLYIRNVTEHDNGWYIAEATMADGEIVTETFFLSIYVEEEGKMKSQLRKIVSFVSVAAILVFVAAVFGTMLWMYAKKTGQGEDGNENLTFPVQDSGEDGNENLTSPVQDSGEDGNENLTSPVQDSDSQESPFISIPLGKM